MPIDYKKFYLQSVCALCKDEKKEKRIHFHEEKDGYLYIYQHGTKIDEQSFINTESIPVYFKTLHEDVVKTITECPNRGVYKE